MTSRRDFVGGTAALAGLLAGCRPRRDEYAVEKRPVPVVYGTRQGGESWVNSTCGLCRAGCGIRVRVVEGRAVKIEGNPKSPVNRGGLCCRGQAAPQLLYHPDRIKQPMRRVGARGENQWQSLSWDEAIASLAAEVAKLRAAGAPESLVLVDGDDQGVTHLLWRRFMQVLGSPNHVGPGAIRGHAQALSEVLSEPAGGAGPLGCDFERARCVLSVGAGPFESSPQLIHLARALAGGARPRLLCASPRLPPAATLVDEWLPIVPGSEAALLWGLAHVLVAERWADESLLERAPGYLSLPGNPSGLRSRIQADYSPAQVEKLTTLPAAQIAETAAALHALRPAAVIVDEWACDRDSMAAALVVNALLANLGQAGGILLGGDPLFEPAPGPSLDPVARKGLSAPSLDGRTEAQAGPARSRLLELPAALLSGQPYPAKVLLLHNSNPISTPDGGRWIEAMARVPLVVSFASILDESALFADLVLPDHSFLERWDLVASGRGARAVSLRQPVVRPIGDSMQTGEVILRLARAVGEPMAGAFRWSSYREAAVAHLSTTLDPQDLLSKLDEAGVVVLDPPTPSPLSRVAISVVSALAERRPLPRVGEAKPFPFVLVPVRPASFVEGSPRELPWLGELPLLPFGPGRAGLACVEAAPEDADRLGIDDGDRVYVESPVAKIEARVHVHSGIKPGVLGVHLGAPSGGRKPGRGQGGEASAWWLFSAVTQGSTGAWVATATRGRIGRGA